MHKTFYPSLTPVGSSGSQVQASDGTWRLEIPAGKKGDYRIAQIDDYTGTARRDFPWRAPVSLSLRARASAEGLPGTWGFGLWNDPFSLSLGFGGATRRFPALPNTAWFFHAAPPNYLSLRDDLPAQGFLAATFRSAKIPAPLLAAAAPSLALFSLPRFGRFLRRQARRYIQQDAALVDDGKKFVVTDWHAYQVDWLTERVIFSVDEDVVLDTKVSPNGPLALVLWIDNQYAALPPDGHLSFGALPTAQPGWIEISEIKLARSER